MIFFLIGNDALKDGFTLFGGFDHADTTAVLVGEGAVQGDEPLGIAGRFGIDVSAVRSCQDFFSIGFTGFLDPFIMRVVAFFDHGGKAGLEHISGEIIKIYLISFQFGAA